MKKVSEIVSVPFKKLGLKTAKQVLKNLSYILESPLLEKKGYEPLWKDDWGAARAVVAKNKDVKWFYVLIWSINDDDPCYRLRKCLANEDDGFDDYVENTDGFDMTKPIILKKR